MSGAEGTGARRPPCSPLLALTPGTLSDGQGPWLLARVGEAARGGLAALLLREPGMSDRALLELARGLRGILGDAPAGWLGVHDRVHVALAAGADAAHLGFRSLSIAAAREAAGGALALGFSAHAGDDPRQWEGADYLFFGPVSATPSKEGRLAPTGFEGLALACRGAPAPVWAIGGLEPADAGGALRAGARGLAVLRGVLLSEQPAAAARAHLRALGEATEADPSSPSP